MIAWLGIIAALIVLVATVGGSLKDEFEIPGSDTQRATDLIEAEFASEQGGVLNLVFAAPEGQTLEDPGAPGRRRGGGRQGPERRVQADRDRPGRDRGHHERRRPVLRPDVLRRSADRLRRGAVRPRDLRGGPRAGGGDPGGGPRDRGARRRHRRVQRGRRVPADRAGHAGAARTARCAHRPADRVPHDRGDGDPARARDRRAHDGLPPAVHPRRPHRHQHDHAAAGVDDRPRRRHRLLAVHRHALPAVPARRVVAA